MALKVAIVGLGRVGGEFLGELTQHGEKGISIRAAAELNDTPGRQLAARSGIELLPLEKLIGLGSEIDIIFDLSGSSSVRRQLREQLEEQHNDHSVVVPETVARLVWSLMTDSVLPDVHGKAGY
jgi:predicted dinucleotide-utilizing enzyme